MRIQVLQLRSLRRTIQQLVSHWLTNSYTKNNKNYFSQQHQQLVSYLSLRFERTIIFTINGQNLAQSKIIHYLCSRILRWREYVLRKAFRNGSFLGQVFDIFKQRLLRFAFDQQKTSQLFNQIRTKVTVNAYGYDYIHTALIIGVACCHISVGFLLFYLFYWAMRRPLLINNQRRSTLFVCLHVCE